MIQMNLNPVPVQNVKFAATNSAAFIYLQVFFNLTSKSHVQVSGNKCWL